jgi:hypothetical protein
MKIPKQRKRMVVSRIKQEKGSYNKLWKHMDGKLFGGKVQFSRRGSARFWCKSLVGDFDTPTDWIFLTEVHNHHLYYLVLASCIIATLLYMYQASGGFFGLLEKKLEKCYKKKEEQQQEEEENK